MKKSQIVLIMSSMFIFLTCAVGQITNSQSATPPADYALAALTEELVNQDQQKYFGIKSGYVRFSSDVAGMEMVREWWFDDYGLKQYEENYMIIMDEKAGDKTLIIDGYQYKWQLDATTGTRMKHYQTITDYDRVSEKDIARYGIKKHGYEEVMGENCLKVSTEKPVNSTSWVWENIVLKTEAEFRGQKVVMNAIEMNTNQPPVTLFELPSDIVFEEY
jgi:hypothetical protein